MQYIACDATVGTKQSDPTAQGYRRFHCRKRGGGVLNRTQYPSDVIALIVFWRLCYKLSLRDLPEMF